MAIKKTALYSSLWASCDELRGGMDASQYKDYVLTLLFLKYVSDKYSNAQYGTIVVPAGASFDDLLTLKGNKDIGESINKAIHALAEANRLEGVINIADFNDEDKLGKGKEMVDRLSNLINIFSGLDMSSNRADGDDLLGDAYEYLMRHFATESGKSKGQFYTPAEVSQILAKVVGITPETPQTATVYDPTCGSGSLLLKASDQAPRGLSIYGQEMDNATSALARMNMILHNAATADIWQGNTLSAPHWKESNGQLKAFDFAVANPPFSNKNWTTGLNPNADPYGRFVWGTPPDKNGDYTFLLHIIKSLKSTGKGAVILPHGVLFRGNAEARIRENLIKQGYIKGIIGLPANLFYGTGIPACIILIDKAQAQARTGIFMIDASKGFLKDGNKNRLRSQDIHKIVDTFNSQTRIDGYSRMVTLKEITKNDYNLNIPRYIDTSAKEDLHDLAAHLNGGIPDHDIDALNSYWKVLPSLRQTLFSPVRDGYSTLRIDADQLKTTILAQPEFQHFARQSLAPFTRWVELAALEQTQQGDLPKTLIHEISEALLECYTDAQLLDKYDVYQLLMDYWDDTMQDDIDLITQDGWQAARSLRTLVVEKGKKLQETPDFTHKKARYKADIIPPALIIARYFAEQQKEVNRLNSLQEENSQALSDFIEEHSADDGLLLDAMTSTDKITAASIKARLKHTLDSEEIDVLKRAQQLISNEASIKKILKEAQDTLTQAVIDKYPVLEIDEIKTLVITNKWLSTLETQIKAEIERITQQLTQRITELDSRYRTPLSELTASVDTLSEKVAGHLKAMGLETQV